MNDPVWLGNYIVPRWEALVLMFGTAAVALITGVIAIGFICGLIKWLVNPTAKPGKQ